MTEKIAMQGRLIREQMLVREYENQLVEIRDALGEGLSAWGRIKTIGVEWAGLSTYEVIVNLKGRRLKLDYEDFMKNTKVL